MLPFGNRKSAMPENSFAARSVSFAECLRGVGPDDLVLTASGRLAREFRQQLAQVGRTLLPQVMPFSAWLSDCWQRLRLGEALDGKQGAGALRLLSDAQEEVVWEDALRDSGAQQQLLFLDETVRACAGAYRLARQYLLPLDDPAWLQTEECRLFLQWTRAVEARCALQHWLLSADLVAWLGPRLAELDTMRGRRVYLAGFDEVSPAQTALFTSLAVVAASVETIEEPSARVAERCWLHVASDAEAEWMAAALWAKRELAENPSARIAVVVPDLAAQYAAVAQVFQQVFYPATAAVAAPPPAADFHISFAPPLFHTALAQTAIHLLRVLAPAPRLAELRYLLRSPYLDGGIAECEPRGLLEAALLGLRLDRLPFAQIHASVNKVAAGLPPRSLDGCQRLMMSLQDGAASVLELPRRAPSAWVAFARGLWSRCLWMDASLTSAEYQLRQRLLEELGALNALDVVLPECSLSQFVRILRNRFQQVGFQPESAAGRVLVAGMYEVTGLRFDAVWLCGFTDRILPRGLAPDPFLPSELQRSCAAPRSDVARERSFAAKLFQRLCRLAPELVVSYPLREGDEELQPSPLLQEMPPHQDYPSAWLTAEEEPANVAVADLLEDWGGGVFVPDGPQLRGGTGVLKNQSDCPFRAYALARLESGNLEWESPLLERLDQGRLAHWALEAFWQRTRTRESLVAMTEMERGTLLSDCIQQSLDRLKVDAGDALAVAQIAAERERLQTILSQWLEEEVAREPFTVEAMEARGTVQVGGAELTLRADRLDRLRDGTFALIDYKTGKADPKKWLGDRPEEPQLLAYLAAESRDVRALAFASLKAGDIGWKLFGDTPETNFKAPQLRKRDVPPQGWTDFARESRETVRRLIAEFESGFAAVDPRDLKSSCEYCDQHPFCRIAEISKDSDDEGGEDA